jgi:hypothetical protein
MADNLVAVEVARNCRIFAQHRIWLQGQTIWLPTDEAERLERQGVVVVIGTYIPPVFQG